MSVFDFTRWSSAKRSGTGILLYPLRSMDEWENLKASPDFTTKVGPLIGRLGDIIKVEDLAMAISLIEKNSPPPSNKKVDMVEKIADTLGSPLLSHKVNGNRGGRAVVCGLPGEIAPDETYDDYFDVQQNFMNSYEPSNPGYYGDQKKTVWALIALKAKDQLRQRMAWGLYQHMNVATTLTVQSKQNEGNLVYYDTFVRNAFGDFKHLLKEVAFSSKIGEQFTFYRSISTRYAWAVRGIQQFPDENFSREVMQLFTIGLHELEMDGIAKLDRYGRHIQTYNNNDILSFARIFTGFEFPSRRGNVEDLKRAPVNGSWSRIDPMIIRIETHDWFPKMDLNDGWIGDRYPLCVDLPERPFLRKGATYRLLGGTSTPRMQFDLPEWDGDESAKRFVLSRESALYKQLCSESSSGKCTYPDKVVLQENLGCSGPECRVDTVRVVQVHHGIFYEYIRVPCTQMAFYVGAKKVIGGTGKGTPFASICAHPKIPVATRACCGIKDKKFFDKVQIHADAHYLGEVVSYENNRDNCILLGGDVCDPTSAACTEPFCSHRGIYTRADMYHAFHWTNKDCSIKLKIRFDGLAAIVHEGSARPVSYVDASNTNGVTYIAIPWARDAITKEELFPSLVSNKCDNNACKKMSDETCLCDTAVSETAVYTEWPSSKEDVLAKLKVGFFPLDMFDNGSFILIGEQNGIKAYKRSGATGDDFTVDTIFELTDEIRRTMYLRNTKSLVKIGTSYEIRNPVSFMDVVDPEVRDAYYEVDALLDHLVRHPNVPPLLSNKLIQYFGISNPSPRYAETVANAFSSGAYTWTDGSSNIAFGTGQYGNLEATAAGKSD